MQTIRTQSRNSTSPVTQKIGAPTRAGSNVRKMKASEVRRLSAADRAKYMLEHSTQAAREYRERPELLIGGGEELLDY